MYPAPRNLFVSLAILAAACAASRAQAQEAAQKSRTKAIAAEPAAQETAQIDKLRRVNIESLELQEMPFSEVLDLLRKAAADSPQKFRVNIVNLVGREADSVKVSLLLKNSSLYDAIQYVARMAGAQCKFEENAVVLIPNNLGPLKQLGVALHAWAADHGDKFPDKLEAVTPDYVDARVLSWKQPQTGKLIPFVYYPGQTVTGAADKMLVAAPEAVNGRRDVLFADGHASTVKEDEFLRLLKR